MTYIILEDKPNQNCHNPTLGLSQSQLKHTNMITELTHNVTGKNEHLLKSLPYNEFRISNEIKEYQPSVTGERS